MTIEDKLAAWEDRMRGRKVEFEALKPPPPCREHKPAMTPDGRLVCAICKVPLRRT